ncbi:MAG: serine/threonine-protein kinase [Myxococcota bacterium]
METYFEFDTLLDELLDGRYKIRGILGEGGQAGVLRAWDKQERRAVALKVLRPEESEDRQGPSVKRFEREAFALMKLQGDNCLRSYGLGVDEDRGLHYMVMELVEGQPLDLFIDFPLTERQVVHICVGIALGLAEAHRHGIFHRDLKPENVILTPLEREVLHRPVLIDFGIAKFSEGYEMTWITATDKVVGTVHYMSPEQAQGLPLDPRTDVYSLGVVLYELLSGQPPFDGAPIRVLQAHLASPVPPIEPRETIRLMESLNTVVDTCLHKEPEGRYPSGAELSEALLAVGSAIEAGAPPVATCMRLSPDGERLAIGFDNGEVEVRDLEHGRRLDRFQAHDRATLGVAWIERGLRLVSADATGELALWTGPGVWSRDRAHLQAGELVVTTMDTMAEGTRVALGTHDGRVRVVKPGSPNPRAELRCHRMPVSTLCFAPDGTRLFSAGEDGAALMWDMHSLDIINRFGVEGEATALGFEPRVGLVAIGSSRGRITLGRLDGGRRPLTFYAHAAEVTSIHFVPAHEERGFDIVTSGLDGELRQWRVDDGMSRPLAGVHPEGIRDAGVAPDGSVLALCDTMVLRWSEHFVDNSVNMPDLVLSSRYPNGWLDHWGASGELY